MRSYSTNLGVAWVKKQGPAYAVDAYANGGIKGENVRTLAFHNEAGFRGRDWEAFDGQQFASLKEIAEEAIAQSRRLGTTRRAVLEAAAAPKAPRTLLGREDFGPQCQDAARLEADGSVVMTTMKWSEDRYEVIVNFLAPGSQPNGWMVTGTYSVGVAAQRGTSDWQLNIGGWGPAVSRTKATYAKQALDHALWLAEVLEERALSAKEA